ncbi:MAG: hypothetical protein ACJ8CB_25500 [Ktedonobacteraceae bacterium]
MYQKFMLSLLILSKNGMVPEDWLSHSVTNRKYGYLSSDTPLRFFERRMGLYPEEERISKMAIDNQTIRKTKRQHTIDLLDQLYFISTALKEVREQRHVVFAQQQALSEQRQILSMEESTLVQEESALLAQLSCLREQRW